MAEQTPTQVETTAEVKGKTVLNVNLPTPMWATWVFRIYFYLANFFLIILTTTNLIPMAEGELKRVIAWLVIVAIGIHGFGRLLGVDTKAIESEAKDAFIQTK